MVYLSAFYAGIVMFCMSFVGCIFGDVFLRTYLNGGVERKKKDTLQIRMMFAAFGVVFIFSLYQIIFYLKGVV